jgi:hypothetical protein
VIVLDDLLGCSFPEEIDVERAPGSYVGEGGSSIIFVFDDRRLSIGVPKKDSKILSRDRGLNESERMNTMRL